MRDLERVGGVGRVGCRVRVGGMLGEWKDVGRVGWV